MYMTPEALRAKPYSHSVNHWSLGYILFGLLADSPPFRGNTLKEIWANLKS